MNVENIKQLEQALVGLKRSYDLSKTGLIAADPDTWDDVKRLYSKINFHLKQRIEEAKTEK